MRPAYIVGILISALLIYLSIYGSAGIGLAFSGSSLPTHEDFNDLSGWSIVRSSASISPAGEVQIVSTSGNDGGLINSNPGSAVAGQASLTYTVTLRLKGDQWGTGTYASGFQLQMYDDAQSFWWRFWVNGSAVWGQDAVNTFVYSVVDDNAYHVYTVPVTVANDKCVFDVYRDAVKCFTGGSQVTSGGTGGSRVSLDVKSYGGGPITVHVDYLYFDAGLHPPNQPPTTATLNVNTQYMSSGTGVPLSGVQVTVGTQTKSSPATFSGLNLGSVSVSVPSTYSSGSNTYTFANWTDGPTSNSRTFNLQADTTLTATYTLNVIPPPTTGTLRVFASYQGTYVSTSVTVTGPQSTSGTTTTNENNPLTFTLVAGIYTITGTYNPGANPISNYTTATVVVGQPVDATLNFAGTQPPPPTTYTLTVMTRDSSGTLLSGVLVTLGSQTGYSTATFSSLTAGTYGLTMSSSYNNMNFAHWEDGSTSNPRTLSLSSTMTVTATYASSSPPSQPWDFSGFLSNLKSILDRVQVRQAELILGGLIGAISGIMFFVPAPKRYYPMPSS